MERALGPNACEEIGRHTLRKRRLSRASVLECGASAPLSEPDRFPNFAEGFSGNIERRTPCAKSDSKAAELPFHYPHLCAPQVQERTGAQKLVILNGVRGVKDLATHLKTYRYSRAIEADDLPLFQGGKPNPAEQEPKGLEVFSQRHGEHREIPLGSSPCAPCLRESQMIVENMFVLWKRNHAGTLLPRFDSGCPCPAL